MKFIAEINVMPLKALLDPQGKAVTRSLQNLGMTAIDQVRIGKHITFEVDAKTEKDAKELVEKACNDLLHNPIMEHFEYQLIKQK